MNPLARALSATALAGVLSGAATAQIDVLVPGDRFTIAVLPDTQNFSSGFPSVYEGVTQWIADNRSARDIVFVQHVGDIVNFNSLGEWAVARSAHDTLSGIDMPQGLAIGNHDVSDLNNPESNNQRYLDNFGPNASFDTNNLVKGSWLDQPWYVGASPSGLSSYQLIDVLTQNGAGQRIPLMFVNIEFGLRPDEVEWARGVIAANPDRVVFLSTHQYIQDYRFLRGRFGDFIDTVLGVPNAGIGAPNSLNPDGLFAQAIQTNPNVAFVWCGHVDGEFRQISNNLLGLPVFEQLINYQSFSPNGGDGWLRLYEFDITEADGMGDVTVQTFSPTTVPGGRLRNEEDQVSGLIEAFEDFGPQVFDVIRPILADLDPLILGFIEGIVSLPNFASNLLNSFQAQDEDFDTIVSLLTLTGIDQQTILDFVDLFPFEQVNLAAVSVLDVHGAEIVGFVLNDDLQGLIDFISANDGELIRQAFIDDGFSTPQFVLEDVAFGAYVGDVTAPFSLTPPCNPADLVLPLGSLTSDDVVAIVRSAVTGASEADFDSSGDFNVFDVLTGKAAFDAGCP